MSFASPHGTVRKGGKIKHCESPQTRKRESDKTQKDASDSEIVCETPNDDDSLDEKNKRTMKLADFCLLHWQEMDSFTSEDSSIGLSSTERRPLRHSKKV